MSGTEDGVSEKKSAKKGKHLNLRELSQKVKQEKWEERKQKEKQEEEKRVNMKKAIVKRKKDHALHTARTKKGQPIMRNLIKDIFSKIQQGKDTGKY